MGLPLFIAPVESDITSKPSTKTSADPAHARSPIRRSERRRQLHETREHRLRLLAALQANDDSLNQPESNGRASGTVSPSADTLPIVRRYSPSSYDDILGLVRDHRDRRERRDGLRSRPSPHPDTNIQHEESFLRADGPEPRYVTWSNESTPDLGSTNWGQVVNLSNGGSLLYRSRLREANASSSNSPALYNVQPHGYPSSASRLTQRLRETNPSGSDTRASRSQVPDPGEYLEEYHRRRNAQPDGPRVSSRPRAWRSVRYVDGLGDRDRSLSPEDNNVWDTLQSTLTPDPQPPSVGSSFASTTASVTTSHTTASSANTSVTHPDETSELPCEPVADDSESDEDGEEQRNESSRRRIPPSSRSYADVVADALPPARGGAERLEWLSDMQRIVQGLASRQDIPDQWWAAAGLSRSFVMGDDSI
ncbi:hypothetical protein PG984_002344 [Apiospora sp. TS-2023a]